MQRKTQNRMSNASISVRPRVHFAGDVRHPDFQSVAELLEGSAQLSAATSDGLDVVMFAQNRPDSVDRRHVEGFRQTAPLAGLVAVAGTWCEGELRTGRPWPGVKRLYWYEFPAWWRRQLALRAAGRCPDWARPTDLVFHTRRDHPHDGRTIAEHPLGIVGVRSPNSVTLSVLGDVLQRAGFASVQQRSPTTLLRIRGTVAGIWDGGQLDDVEAADLSRFCQQYASANAPAITLLDFPRRDRVELALQLGASAVFGKPWINADLIATLQSLLAKGDIPRAA
jgi:hypothetical protein